MEKVQVNQMRNETNDTDYALIIFEDKQKELVCLSTSEWVDCPGYELSLIDCGVETEIAINGDELFVDIAIKASAEGEWFNC